MFENNTPQPQPQNPLNPVMPAPGMTNAQVPAPAAPTTFAPPSAQVHSMPERFRNTGPAAGGSPGAGKTKKLLITLVIVVVVAGLGVVGLLIFNKVVKSNTNNTNIVNSTNTTNTVTNVANKNTTANTNTSVNQNVNAVNTNSSANVNGAVNGNTNVATNTVRNTNASTNINAVTNISTNTNTAISTTPLPSNTDTDGDGLTDTEELVYGTDATKSDTDGDGFIDGRKVDAATGAVSGELAMLYNPLGTGKLETSTIVKNVQNAAKAYQLLIPATWTINESSGLLVITPATTTGEFFQIRTYENTAGLSAQQWYQTTFPQGQANLTKSIAVNGLEGIVSPDGASVYFFKDTRVFGLTYTTGSLSQVNFWTTFEMMKNSFKLVAA